VPDNTDDFRLLGYCRREILTLSFTGFDPEPPSVARRFRNAPNPSATSASVSRAKNMRGHFSSIFRFSKRDLKEKTL
jgi:hypothetical protein